MNQLSKLSILACLGVILFLASCGTRRIGSDDGTKSTHSKTTKETINKLAVEFERISGAEVEKINDGQGIKITFQTNTLFTTNSSSLIPTSSSVLNELATILQNHPDTKIEIYGHTDSTGSDAINNPLSRFRANAILHALETRNIATDRMQAHGLGSSQPLGDNATAEGRKQNLRVEILVLPETSI